MDSAKLNERVSHDGYFWDSQKCPICNLVPQKLIGLRGGRAHRENLGVETEIWKCDRCSLIFPNPMPIPIGGLGQHYDVDAGDYFINHNIDEKSANAEKLINRAEEILGRKGKLLDIGVGRGEVLLAAKNSGWIVEGVEPSQTFADFVEERTGAKIWRQPFEESDVSDGEYDVIILGAVLEHLYNPDKIIEKISRALKQGGLLYVDVPNEVGLFFKVGNLYQKMRGRDWCVNLAPTFSPFHIFGFSPKSLRILLNKYGLESKYWSVYGGTSLVQSRGGMFGKLENIASKMITAISNISEMGTYIETWAVKR